MQKSAEEKLKSATQLIKKLKKEGRADKHFINKLNHMIDDSYKKMNGANATLEMALKYIMYLAEKLMVNEECRISISDLYEINHEDVLVTVDIETNEIVIKRKEHINGDSVEGLSGEDAGASEEEDTSGE